MNLEAMVRSLEARLRAHGTPERAAGAKRYLKSELRFLGTAVPAVRREAKAFAEAHPGIERRELRALCERLWASDVHELRSLAIGILERRRDLLRATDAPWLISFVRRADTWAHVDWLATKVLGAVVSAHPSARSRLDRWAVDPNFWVRRSALLALHDPLLAGAGDFEHFARLAGSMLREREFFIRKAIGWVLRSASRKRPGDVVAFVEAHAAEMSALTFKEATRHLPAAQRRRLERLRAPHAVRAGVHRRRGT